MNKLLLLYTRGVGSCNTVAVPLLYMAMVQWKRENY